MTDEEMMKRVASLKRKRAELKRLQEELLEDSKVQEYVEVSDSLRDTDSIIRILNQSILKSVQENCEHPAWVLLYKDSDPEGRVYYKCRCVACGKEEKDYAGAFPKGRVIFEYSHDIYRKWDEFSEENLDASFSVEEKGKTFTKIYNSNRKH